MRSLFRLWPVVLLASVVSFVAAGDAAAQSCGDLGGTHCSQTGSCPNGYDNLGGTFDCDPCCREAEPEPSCGEMGGDYCSQSGSCPSGYQSLGRSSDCHPCCKEQLQQQPSCGELGGDYCSQSGGCPSGYDSLGGSSDCHPCCRQREQIPSCGQLGGSYCSQSGSCPPGHQNLGTSSDCHPCCQPGPSCGELGGDYCSQTSACPQGYANLGVSPDCTTCCRVGLTCGAMGGSACGQNGVCPAGTTSLGISTDCNPCCGAAPPPPGTDDALPVAAVLPSSLACSATFAASVTMKNIGSTTWTSAGGYKLGAVGDGDPFYPSTRVNLPDGVSVAPGASYTFSMTLTAPAGGATQVTDWQMVRESVHWFGGVASSAVTVACTQSGDHAETVSDGLPRSLLCATAATASVTLRNTGSIPWTAADGYELAALAGSDPFLPAARVGLPAGLSVPSTQSYTFTLALNAPALQGVYASRWQMRHNGAWFGPVVGGDVTVACQQQGDNAWVTAIDLPFALRCGEHAEGSITMMNVGSAAWRRVPGHPDRETYKLGVPGNSDPFTTDTRVGLGGAVVEPGASFTFPLSLSAPATDGTYTTYWQMVYSDGGNETWFGSPAVRTVRVSCQDVDDSAREAATLPAQLAAGQQFQASVTMKNIGTTTWSAGQGYRLGAVDDSDPFTAATRVELPRNVGPGDKLAFVFTLQGTGQDGHTDWRMVHDGVGWFGDTAGQDVHATSGGGSTDYQLCSWTASVVDPTGQRAAADAFQKCIDLAPGEDPTLLVRPGTYRIDKELHVTRRIRLGSTPPENPGTWPTTTCSGEVTCAVLLAAPDLDDPGQLLFVHDTDHVVLDHIVLDGNRGARKNQTGPDSAATRCAQGLKNAPNARVHRCDDCQFVYSVSRNSLCASGLEWIGDRAMIHDSLFKDNGDYGLDANGVRVNTEMWSDGLTLLRSDGAQVVDNTFDSNSDVGLILGGGTGAFVLRNTIKQVSQWAFGGLMLDNFGNSQSGDFTGTIVGGAAADANTINCNGKCQFGIQLGPHPWYIFERDSGNGLLCTRPVRNIIGGTVTHNAVTNALQGLNIDGAGTQAAPIEVHDNAVSGSSTTPQAFFNCSATRPTSNFNYFLVPQQGGPPNGDSWVDTKGIATPTPFTRNSFHPCDDARACNRPPVARLGGSYSGVVGQAVTFDGSASSDSDGFITSYAWDYGDGHADAGPALTRPTHTYTGSANIYTVRLTVTDDLGVTAFATAPVTMAANQVPTVSVAASGACGAGCTVTFTSSASDPEGGPVTRAWSGCATGTADAASCARSSSGTIAATLSVSDMDGLTAAASAAVPVYAATYATGTWAACAGTAAYTCTAASATGCSRPGTQTRAVTETSWTLNSAAAPPAPAGSQVCTQTTQGYVASWSVGGWGNCDAPCGGGLQYRSVTPASFKATPPAAARPADSQSCNTSPCRLSCGDYGLYSRRRDCEAEWPYCDVRYRDDGVGGLLMCWMGYR